MAGEQMEPKAPQAPSKPHRGQTCPMSHSQRTSLTFRQAQMITGLKSIASELLEPSGLGKGVPVFGLGLELEELYSVPRKLLYMYVFHCFSAQMKPTHVYG